MQENRLKQILDQLENISIAVVGDYFLDKLLMIDSALDETSLETGLTAYQVTEKVLLPGAAGTVCNNLCALGIGRIYAVGAIGLDGEGFELKRELNRRGVDTQYLVSDASIFTPTYTKPIIKNTMRELNRLDIRNRAEMSEHLQKAALKGLYEVIGKVDAIIALDQVVEENLGIITNSMRDCLSSLGKKSDKIIYADSRAHLDKFSNIILKCNNIEAALITGNTPQKARNISFIKKCAIKIAERNEKCAFVTCGDMGIVAAEHAHALHAKAVRVEGEIDICGAGDAATAGIVSALCSGATAYEAAQLANIISSITIQQIGVTGTATRKQVMEVFSALPPDDEAL